MVLLCSAVSLVLDAFPEAPPGACWWQKQTLCTQESWAQPGTSSGCLACWNHCVLALKEVLLTTCFGVRTLNGLNWLYNGHEVLAAISFSLKTEQKAAACLGLAASPMTGSWTTPAYSLLLWGPLLPAGLENSWILTPRFFDITVLSPTAIKSLVCRDVLVFHQPTLARRGKLPLSCISVLKFHMSLWIFFKTKPH